MSKLKKPADCVLTFDEKCTIPQLVKACKGFRLNPKGTKTELLRRLSEEDLFKGCNVDTLSGCTVLQLKRILASKRLSTFGRKPELQERIIRSRGPLPKIFRVLPKGPDADAVFDYLTDEYRCEIGSDFTTDAWRAFNTHDDEYAVFYVGIGEPEIMKTKDVLGAIIVKQMPEIEGGIKIMLIDIVCADPLSPFRGVGSKLMQRAEIFARERGNKIMLLCSLPEPEGYYYHVRKYDYLEDKDCSLVRMLDETLREEYGETTREIKTVGSDEKGRCVSKKQTCTFMYKILPPKESFYPTDLKSERK